MRCALCDGEGTVRALPWNDDVVVSVMCAAHEWACVSAVSRTDYEAVEVALRVAEPGVSGEVVAVRARAIAVLRVLALQHTDPDLFARLADAMLSLPSDADELDAEWAALGVLRERGV